jgi:hypothetical protein
MESGMLCGYAAEAGRPARHYDGILMLPLERLPLKRTHTSFWQLFTFMKMRLHIKLYKTQFHSVDYKWHTQSEQP